MSNCNKLVIIYTTLVVTIDTALVVATSVATMFFIVSVLFYALRSALNKNKDLEPEEELVKDMLQIMNIFTAKMNGLRKYKEKD